MVFLLSHHRYLSPTSSLSPKIATVIAILVHYACIAKGTTVLVEFNPRDESLSSITATCLEKTPRLHSTFTHTVRAQTYTFLIDDPFAYFTIFDQSMENLKGLAFLKSVKEAFDVVGNEERIHVYYAHGEDNPTFVHRCYWLLKSMESLNLENLSVDLIFVSLEHSVLVDYRETQELQGSPATPVNSNAGSAVSDPSAHWPLSEESDTAGLHEINTLEWDEIVLPVHTNKPLTPQEDNPSKDGLQAQDSFGRWIKYITADFPGSVDDQTLESSISARYQSFTHPINDNHGLSVLGQIFNITDVSPSWGLSNEETKILVVGFSMKDNYPSPSPLYSLSVEILWFLQ
ncbi:calmodulin binding [Abeliophyllum distichum]|uniref:Calmodulin binding n=1 Tax=Abeliophyllum distichum TaxID=126358 RepID=A0ABD1T1Q1_9LAMI